MYNTLKRITSLSNLCPACAVVVLVAAGCGGVGEYMPLEPDNWWEYRTEVYETIGAMEQVSYRDLRYAEITFSERSELHGHIHWMTRVMDDVNAAYGYYISTSNGALTIYQELESTSGEVYLAEPLEVGNTWTTHARQDPEILVTGEILSVSDTVHAPFETFTDCIRVQLVSTRDVLEQYPGPESITWEFWFAAGFGIVRSTSVIENPVWMFRRRVTQVLVDYSL